MDLTSQSAEIASPEKVLSQNRKHWSIENKVYYVLDVTYDEDHSRIRSLNGPMVMTTLRRFAISLLRLHDETNISQTFRKLWESLTWQFAWLLRNGRLKCP
jgi:hypothetical protein